MEPVAAALAQLAEAQAVCNFLTGLCAKELEALSDSASHATSPAWASAGIAAVVRLCHDPASAASAAATLANLSWADDANGDRIREAGAIPQLVALLSGGPESDAGTKAALVLGYLASNVSLGLAHIVTITEAGAIPLLVALLTGGPESDAATNAALALGYLASSGANTVAITEAGAIPLLVALLSGGPESDAATNAAFALGHLAESGANTVAITEAGALALLVALLSGGPDSEAAEHAAGVLRNLTLNDNATSTAITNAGAIPPLVALLSGGSEPRAADAAAGALHNLACYTNSKAVLLEMARTQTDCSSWQSLCVTLHEFASARLQAAEAERQKRLLRLWEINGDAERQARRESFGLGSLELPDEFVCPITMDKMRGVSPPPSPPAPLAHPGFPATPAPLAPQTRSLRLTATHTSGPPSSRCSATATA
eukprot:scaffold21327_cov66-Phaeocystis_antarctica.AAC.8